LITAAGSSLRLPPPQDASRFPRPLYQRGVLPTHTYTRTRRHARVSDSVVCTADVRHPRGRATIFSLSLRENFPGLSPPPHPVHSSRSMLGIAGPFPGRPFLISAADGSAELPASRTVTRLGLFGPRRSKGERIRARYYGPLRYPGVYGVPVHYVRGNDRIFFWERFSRTETSLFPFPAPSSRSFRLSRQMEINGNITRGMKYKIQKQRNGRNESPKQRPRKLRFPRF